MKKTLLTIVTAIYSSIALFAQTPTQRVCGTLQHHNYLKQTRPNYENDLNQYNQVIEQYLANQAASRSSVMPIVTIPVVVHIVYNTAAENITDAQAASQVQVLNDDFAKLNTDANKVTQPTFSTVAAGSNIRFCLAQRDPNGNATTGIVHKSTTLTSFGTNDAVKSSASGGDDPWDVTKYVNIWVCDLSGSLLGYGEFPTGTISQTWGLVIDYAYTGSGGSATAPFNLGRTGTHEFGHCFNLNHIWGDDGTGCTGTDNCADTPNQAGEHYGCFTQGSIQTDACSPSSPGTMWMNYMDYTDDACMYMFTANQVARMEAVVNTAPWNILQTSLGCTPVSALDAGISSVIAPVNGSSTCNNSVIPKVTLANVGSTTLTSATINYKMDALATQTLSWTGSLASGTSTVLTLNTYAGLTNAAHTFSVWVTSPNGGTDQNAANNSMSSTFTVVSAPVGAVLPFIEGFESTTFPPAGWLLQKSNTISSTNTWTRLLNTTGLTAGSTAIAKMDNFSGSVDISGQKDALRTPALSFSNANSSLKVKFDVSHRIYSTTDIDTLNVYISTDCGGSWTRLYTKGGSQLATVAGSLTSAYTPTANAQWRRDSISLSAYAGQASVYLKFENRSGWGNNLYLDNINVSFVSSSLAPVANFSMSTTSGCTGASVQLTDLSTNSPTSWTWTSTPALGVVFSNANAQNPTVTFANPGIYSIALTASNSIGSSSITKTISVASSPTVTANSATVCSGNSATLTAIGATTYSWNTGATTSSISVTPSITTNYTVVGTTGGCTNTKTVSVTVNTTPTVAVNNVTVCGVTTTTLTATGATTYNWSTGATTASISVSPTVTTVYTVTGTSGSCSNTKTVSITVKNTPTVTASNATVCVGSSTVLNASGATTYSWNTSATTASISVTPSITTNYTVTGTSNGCSNTKTVSVTVNAQPTVAVNNATICTGSSTVISASGATSYSWNTGATTSTISVSPTINTTYTVVGTNSVGCTNTKTVSVTVNSLPNVTSTSATICVGSTGTITASGAATYTWNTGATGASFTASPASNTTYTVTGTSSVGCVKTATGEIVVGLAPSISVNSATICSGNSTTLSASGVTTYTWNTGATTSSISVTPTTSTVYTVTGNLSGCTATATKTVSVTVKATPTVAVSNATVCSGNSANLLATGATTYAWNTGALTSSISVTPSVTTNYTVTGTTNGCTNTKTTSVVVNTTPTVAVNNATLCSGSSVNLSASGATSYSWNTGATTAVIAVTPSVNTTYTVVGSNAGCTNTKTVSVTVNTTPTVAVNNATVCSGTSTNLLATGATSYSWNTGATTSTISVNPSTTTVYTITGTSLGCSNSQVATVVVNALPIVSVSNVTICVGSTGTLSASGASTYSWNTGATSSNLMDNPITTTTYTVTGTSVEGCDNSVSATINVISAPSISVNSTTICAGSTATLAASGVTTYTWNTTSNSSTIFVNPTSTSIYTVSGNLTGCSTTAIQEVTVTVNSLPNVTLASVAGPLCVNNAAVALVGSPAGGVYSGTGVSGSSFDPAVSGAGTFTLTYAYTDANTCSASATQTVDVSLCTGIQEIISDMVSVYPNPTKELIYVKLDASIVNQSTIELYDAIGKLVVFEKVNSAVTTISLANYARGIYSMRIVADGTQNIIKVIKE